MNSIIKRFENIKSLINNSNVKIIAVSKTFAYEHIKPLVDIGHVHFGENKVQEAQHKWQEVKNKSPNINLHMIGKLQSNKVKDAVLLFDYIHSLDNQKLAIFLAKHEKLANKKLKYLYRLISARKNKNLGLV
jgi:uncharacterized pyridoxal phosphate-containing UPF0001 family protein